MVLFTGVLGVIECNQNLFVRIAKPWSEQKIQTKKSLKNFNLARNAILNTMATTK